MNEQTLYEAEQVYTWLNSGQGTLEQENAMNWLTSIGSGAAQGAATGLAAGPWGALIGGLIGAGMGAVQQATQPQTPQRPPAAQRPPPPARPRLVPPPAPRPAPQAAPPPVPRPTPPLQQPASSPPPPSGGTSGAAAVQQIVQLLPQLVQLVQAIQPALASAQQSSGAGENISETSSLQSLAGDPVPDNAFPAEQAPAVFEMETIEQGEEFGEADDGEDHIEWPTPIDPDTPKLPSTPLTPSRGLVNLASPGEWLSETEAAIGWTSQAGFRWAA